MIFYSYEEFKEDVKILAKEIKKDFVGGKIKCNHRKIK